MTRWVIRRVCDGLFWAGYEANGVSRMVSNGLDAAFWNQRERDAKGLVGEGEEWVELDDAGQPVEAKAVAIGVDVARAPLRMWVIRYNDGMYQSRKAQGSSLYVDCAIRYGEPQVEWTGARCVPVLVHPDGTVTLDEPAPAVAQPSPYSEDEPIPYKLSGRRVYLASALPNRGRATALAAQLARDGVEIVSTWHDRDDATVEREAAEDRNELAAIAEGCLAEIDSATDLVWMHGHAEGRVGAAVEVGYALARGKHLLLLSLDGSPAPSAFGALGAAVTVSGLYRAVAR